jgi:hypothetical protein
MRAIWPRTVASRFSSWSSVRLQVGDLDLLGHDATDALKGP